MNLVEAFYQRHGWVRGALKLWVPIGAAVYLLTFNLLFDGILKDVADGSQTLTPSGAAALAFAVIAVALVPIASFTAKRYDEHAARERQIKTDREFQDLADRARHAELEAVAWKHRTRLYIYLNNVLNELVRDKSEGYIEAIRNAANPQEIATHLGRYDNLGRNIDRILQVAYHCIESQYGDALAGRELAVVFFDTLNDPTTLSLRSFCNRKKQQPRSLGLGETNSHLRRDGFSFASLVWKTGRIQILPDTAAAMQTSPPKFVAFREQHEHDVRSIVGYPVQDPNLNSIAELGLKDATIGVICVKSNEQDTFQTDMEAELSAVMESIANRISFEMRRFYCKEVMKGDGG